MSGQRVQPHHQQAVRDFGKQYLGDFGTGTDEELLAAVKGPTKDDQELLNLLAAIKAMGKDDEEIMEMLQQIKASDKVSTAGILDYITDKLTKGLVEKRVIPPIDRKYKIAVKSLISLADSTAKKIKAHLKTLSAAVAKGDLVTYTDTIKKISEEQAKFSTKYANVFAKHIQARAVPILEARREAQKEEQRAEEEAQQEVTAPGEGEAPKSEVIEVGEEDVELIEPSGEVAPGEMPAGELAGEEEPVPKGYTRRIPRPPPLPSEGPSDDPYKGRWPQTEKIPEEYPREDETVPLPPAPEQAESYSKYRAMPSAELKRLIQQYKKRGPRQPVRVEHPKPVSETPGVPAKVDIPRPPRSEPETEPIQRTQRSQELTVPYEAPPPPEVKVETQKRLVDQITKSAQNITPQEVYNWAKQLEQMALTMIDQTGLGEEDAPKTVPESSWAPETVGESAPTTPAPEIPAASETEVESDPGIESEPGTVFEPLPAPEEEGVPRTQVSPEFPPKYREPEAPPPGRVKIKEQKGTKHSPGWKHYQQEGGADVIEFEPATNAENKEFVKLLVKAAKSNNPKLIASMLLKYSEYIEDKRPEDSLKFIAIAEGILDA